MSQVLPSGGSMALPRAGDATGAALWKLTVHGVELEGLRIVVNREFRPAG